MQQQRPVVLLDSCVEGRDAAEMKKLVTRVLDYGLNAHKMTMTHLSGESTLNFLYFRVDPGTVITDRIVNEFMSEFKGSTMQYGKWKVPVTATRRRSLSPTERLSRPDAWMFEVKMISIYSILLVLFALKLLDIQ